MVQHENEIHLSVGHAKSRGVKPSIRGNRVWIVATIATSIALIVGAVAGVLFSQLVLSPNGGCNVSGGGVRETADEQVGGNLGRNEAAMTAASGNSDTRQQTSSGSGVQAFASPMRLNQAGQCLEARLRDIDTGEQTLALHVGECSFTSPSQLWRMDIYGRIRSADVQSHCIVFKPSGESSKEGDSSEDESSSEGAPSSESLSNLSGLVELEDCASAELTGGQWMQTSGGHIRLRENPEWCLDANAAENGDGVNISPCVHDSKGQLFSTQFPVEGPDVSGPKSTPAPTMPGPSSAPEGFNFYLGKSCETASIEAATLPSAEACGEMCFADPQCNAYSYKTRNQRCYTKEDCDEWEEDENFVSGIKPFYDIEGGGAGELICTNPEDEDTCDSDSLDRDEQECPVWSKTREESSDPLLDEASSEFVSPYQDIIDGDKEFITTYPENHAWPTCPFRAPTGPRSTGWVDECIENARAVGFLNNEMKRPNSECPAGWFLCKGMCYTIAQRHSVGPSTIERGEHHASDYMNIEARCGLCGGARVAFVGDDPEMEKVAAEAAAQSINGDQALYARRFRFLEKPNPKVERGEPFQAWYRFVELNEHDRRDSTYQRFYTGEKDGLRSPRWDKDYRNQEASILCVNTIDRINAAARIVESRLTMEDGCAGDDLYNRWDDHHHRWFPEHNWPYPGL